MIPTASRATFRIRPQIQNVRHQMVLDVLWWGRTDSLFCGKATPVETVHRTVSKSRLSNPPSNTKVPTPYGVGTFVVGEDGFEPSKRNAADLQSVPFGHSGTPPYSIGSTTNRTLASDFGAGRRTRHTKVTTSLRTGCTICHRQIAFRISSPTKLSGNWSR